MQEGIPLQVDVDEGRLQRRHDVRDGPLDDPAQPWRLGAALDAELDRASIFADGGPQPLAGAANEQLAGHGMRPRPAAG